MLGTLLGIGASMGLNWINNQAAQSRADRDRQLNFGLNEAAANNADIRTRQLYEDIYAPKALLRQYREAGLSPSMMYGGTPGQGGMSGAQGSGSAGNMTPYLPMSLLEASQARLNVAEANKVNAETKNVEADTRQKRQETILKQAQEMWQTFLNKEKRIEVELTTTAFEDHNGNVTSLYEIANNCYNYDEFVKAVRTAARESGDFATEMNSSSEKGQRVLREIYYAANKFETDIQQLATAETSAKFQQSIIAALASEGFAEQNAKTTLKQLKSIGEASDLTETQKGAWNRIIQKMQNKNSTTADIIIVLSMILNQAASNWKLPGVNITNQYNTRTNNTYEL